ncbi:MAG: trypsin-like peptidase domain-containing protein [Bacillota bacterium]|nr:trypsin-like peptidase domain-containing protein [Bacillota bacterium]
MRKQKIYLLIFIVVLTALIPSVTVSAGADNSVRIQVNGDTVSNQGRVIDGKVYVPVDSLYNSLDLSADWNQSSNTVYLRSQTDSVADIVKKVSPSVVGIIGKIKQESPEWDENSDNIVFGSGVIYKAEGYIITNAHVVTDMDKIVVVLSNGKSYLARLKAIDEKSDLALIKIDKGGLTPAVFGDINKMSVGDTVVAIGTPLSFSLRNTATKGIISGINRPLDGEYRFIQSDVAINGGNSGGPLVNMYGQVIGINSVKYSGYGVEGMSFSIPSDTVKYIVGQFEKYGRVRRPYLGADFSEGVAATYGLPSDEGLSITAIADGSPAQKANLQVEDIVTAINGAKVTTIVEYYELLKKYLPGDTVSLTVDRDDKTIKVKVTFDEEK